MVLGVIVLIQAEKSTEVNKQQFETEPEMCIVSAQKMKMLKPKRAMI